MLGSLFLKNMMMFFTINNNNLNNMWIYKGSIVNRINKKWMV
jgi:hypothetical protein